MRKLMVAIVATVLLVTACSKKPAADLTRSVMDALLEAERDHRASRGGFWRDRQPQLDRGATMKALGVDIGDAPSFDFTIEPPDGGMDPKLRVTARGRGEEASLSLSCVQDAAAEKPECAESAAGAS